MSFCYPHPRLCSQTRLRLFRQDLTSFYLKKFPSSHPDSFSCVSSLMEVMVMSTPAEFRWLSSANVPTSGDWLSALVFANPYYRPLLALRYEQQRFVKTACKYVAQYHRHLIDGLCPPRLVARVTFSRSPSSYHRLRGSQIAPLSYFDSLSFSVFCLLRLCFFPFWSPPMSPGW